MIMTLLVMITTLVAMITTFLAMITTLVAMITTLLVSLYDVVGVVGNDYDVLPGTQLECASWWNPS